MEPVYFLKNRGNSLPQTKNLKLQSAGSRSVNSSTLSLNPWGFESKTAFDASGHLIKCRSESYLIRPKPEDNDIWKRPPPDFRMQCYEPSPPKRNTREANKPWKYGTFTVQKKMLTSQSEEVSVSKLPKILQNFQKRAKSPQFISSIRLPDSWDAKVDYPINGKYPCERYENPKPHDYRGYPKISSLGLDEFLSKYEKDPYDIKFKTDSLNIIHGIKTIDLRDITGRQMGEIYKQGKKWDAKLILPKEKFPNKAEETTRHRRLRRSVQSALFERVEAKLNARWAKEKLDNTLKKHQNLHQRSKTIS